MRIRPFTVPFSKIVGDDATEVEYGPDDALVVRPLFGLPAAKAQEWIKRIEEVQKLARAGDEAASEQVDEITLDILREQVVSWHLDGDDGPILKPATSEDLDRLPLALRAGLFQFLINYRGEQANPTTAG